MTDLTLTPEQIAAATATVAPVAAPITTQATQSPVAPDPFLASLRERLPEIPEGTTWETFQSHLYDMQTKADEAEALRQRIAEMEAKLVSSAQQQQPPAPQTAAEAKAQREWEAMNLDPQIQSYVKPDPTGNGYIPLNPLNSAHIQAAEQMNRKVDRDQRLLRAVVDNPYETIPLFMQDMLEKQRAEWEEKFTKFQEQFTPIQEQIAQTQKEREMNVFATKNASVLFSAEDPNQLTPVGQLTEAFMEQGVKPDDALQKAVALAATLLPPPVQQQQAPPAPVSIPKLAPPKPTAAMRIMERMATSGQIPPDKTPYQAPTNKRPQMRDILAANGVSVDQ